LHLLARLFSLNWVPLLFNCNNSFIFSIKISLSELEIEKPVVVVSSTNIPETLSGKNIAVDLTPLLSGGENNDAKLTTLELIRALADLLPQTTFMLLTAESNHTEFGLLENEHPNIQRMCALHNNPSITTTIIVHPAIPTWVERALNKLKILARRTLPPSSKQRIKHWLYHIKHRSHDIPESEGLLRQLRADLLFCPFTIPFYADRHIPTVSVIDDLQYRTYPQFFTPDELIQREDAFITTYRNANYLIATSEFVRQTVIKAADLSPECVVTIFVGLFHPPEQPESETARNAFLEKHNLHSGEYLLYPANFVAHKNHAMLLTAFGLYRQANPESMLKLVCTGTPGPRAETFCDAARRMGLANWVIYPGFVSSDEYDYLLISAFALIFPSLYEDFGISILEAMAAGVPVLSSDVTSLPEVGGDAVLYFDPRKPAQIVEALTRLVDIPGLRESQITRGLQRWRQFGGADRMARQYVDVFVRAVSTYSRKL
jgi:glycosyltransferase involved in cell wall biosynthesis